MQGTSDKVPVIIVRGNNMASTKTYRGVAVSNWSSVRLTLSYGKQKRPCKSISIHKIRIDHREVIKERLAVGLHQDLNLKITDHGHLL